MKITAVVTTLFLLSGSIARGQGIQVNNQAYLEHAAAPIQLFISCDLISQFTTPSIDPATLVWFETPVSKVGAMLHEMTVQRSGWCVVRAPLLLEERSLNQEQASQVLPVEIRDERAMGQARLAIDHK